MAYFLLGLVLFLGLHSVRAVAPEWRTRLIHRFGAGAYKGAYSVISLASLLVLVWGFGQWRHQAFMLWIPPTGMRHATALLTLLAFILLTAAFIPRNFFKTRWHHPMILAVKVWALAHLLANGSLADVLLFGAFLVWSVLLFISARRNDRALQLPNEAASPVATGVTVVFGVVCWAVFAFLLHGWLIGVQPFS